MKCTNLKKHHLTFHFAAAAIAVSAMVAHAQYAPPPPPAPFPGFANEYLRKKDPYLAQWDIGGSWRLRYEVKDGYAIQGVGAGATASLDFRKNNSDMENDYLLSRLRVRLGYADKWWSVLVEGRSSFAIDDERFAYVNPVPAVPGTVNRKGDGPESDKIDLHQAFVTVGNHKEFPVSLKIGRQELIYGDERLIGAFGWNNIGRVFDAAKVRWQNAWFAADFFGSHVVIPEDDRFNVSNEYDYFSGVYITTPKLPKHLVEAYFLARNASAKAIAAQPSPQFPQPSERNIYTVGGRVKSGPGEFGNWDYTLEGAWQFGDFQDRRLGVNSPVLDHNAWMLIAQGGYTFADAWSAPRLAFEYAFGSGDSNPTDGRHETFDNLFPTNHKFYGYMDFISLQNIHDVRGIFTLKPHPRVSVAIEGHGFWLANTHDNFYNVSGLPRGGITTTPGTGYGINPAYDAFVGTELDVIAGWAVTRYAQLEAGYGHFFVGNYVRQSLSDPTRGSRDANFFYVQLGLNF